MFSSSHYQIRLVIVLRKFDVLYLLNRKVECNLIEILIQVIDCTLPLRRRRRGNHTALFEYIDSVHRFGSRFPKIQLLPVESVVVVVGE